ncbi:hypothetical protein CFC21_043262 [Triticum aestivum]|uniref:Leucine-rich repeat-containing N-terminal plant-type domain-containing protein n=2 Tax=Triticum aestivum TaxID=4565 RepID=A0A9R1JWC1_WHEAT|nr:hypothetical protein CFC21_043262 [Triticum aestivum]
MHGYTKLVVWLLLLSILSSYFAHGISDSMSNIQCLKDLKQSLIDPNGRLKPSWNFTVVDRADVYSDAICSFTCVVCWSSGDSRVLSLSLGKLGLECPFPRGLELCTSMTTLDLSNNNFSGPLLEHISQQMTYITYLDLSNNSFSGVIPASIANMTYLSTLALHHNQFDSEIPVQLGNTSRLISFNVADNSLSSPVPDSAALPASQLHGQSRALRGAAGQEVQEEV